MRSATTILACILIATTVFAQWVENPQTGSPQQQLPDQTKMAGMTGLAPELKAGIVDEGKNAKQRKAVVRADVWGVNMVSPGDSGEPKGNNAYLSFVLDNNPPVRTDQKEYTFSNVSRGRHTITVRLLSTDGQEIGSNVVLGFRIPQ